ncbi:34590_t:CDS:2 [Gigaspora margarita]|uniref:34590_t:CDS:1 n=1 Tax=Gigaspora margarita TaxID=4874 RepID=A0ABN7UJ10_GIGMA|nr:34590_t:CDS:2 [Gigaspora margarita]
MSLYTDSSNSNFSRNVSFSNRYVQPLLIFLGEEFSEKAKWEEVALPYVLATGVTIEEYEQRIEEFSVHGCWEWRERKVIIYELPSLPHEVCISAIVEEINVDCSAARSTNAKVVGLGTTKADISFRPKKPAVTPQNRRGPLGKLVEMAYSETLDHVEEALYYLLSPGRAHCKNRSGSQRRNVCPYETPLNISKGQCIINISLKAESTIQNPRELLPDPIPIDFFLVRLALKVAIA